MQEGESFTSKRFNVPNIIPVIILLVLVCGSAYYLYANRPCAQTIYYRVGTLDPRFGISQTDFLADAQQAADLWNAQEGKTLLAYSATGTMPVNLIFDNRQEESDVNASLTQQENELASEKSQVDTLQTTYDAGKQKLASDEAAGEDPSTLNAEIDSLNQQAAVIKTQVDALNAKIDAVNANVTSYNAQKGGDFEEGEFVEQDYQSHIDLYEFQNTTQLVRLMAHEFGHSLGLAHNPNPDSIMYPENIATTIALSTDDKAELQARCALTIQNLNPFQQLNLSSQ